MPPIAEQLRLPSSYGSPNQLLEWATIEQRLVDSLHYWLATVRGDGTPHVVPIDGMWLDGACYFGGDRANRMLVLGDPLFTTYAPRIAELALRHRLPCIGLTRNAAEDGMLAAYGPSFEDAYRRAAHYVDRILKGAQPAELPVERSQRFELTLNRRTARALKFELPQALLVRADHLID